MNEEAIKAICIALWAIGGAIAFGGFFSLATNEEKKTISKGKVFDHFVFSGFFSAISDASENWNKKKESKWLFLIGLALVFSGGLLWFWK